MLEPVSLVARSLWVRESLKGESLKVLSYLEGLDFLLTLPSLLTLKCSASHLELSERGYWRTGGPKVGVSRSRMRCIRDPRRGVALGPKRVPLRSNLNQWTESPRWWPIQRANSRVPRAGEAVRKVTKTLSSKKKGKLCFHLLPFQENTSLTLLLSASCGCSWTDAHGKSDKSLAFAAARAQTLICVLVLPRGCVFGSGPAALWYQFVSWSLLYTFQVYFCDVPQSLVGQTQVSPCCSHGLWCLSI